MFGFGVVLVIGLLLLWIMFIFCSLEFIMVEVLVY